MPRRRTYAVPPPPLTLHEQADQLSAMAEDAAYYLSAVETDGKSLPADIHARISDSFRVMSGELGSLILAMERGLPERFRLPDATDETATADE